MLNAKADLPTPGRAAKIINWPGWKPYVNWFNSSYPVSSPVSSPSSLSAFFSITSNTFSVATPIFSIGETFCLFTISVIDF